MNSMGHVPPNSGENADQPTAQRSAPILLRLHARVVRRRCPRPRTLEHRRAPDFRSKERYLRKKSGRRANGTHRDQNFYSHARPGSYAGADRGSPGGGKVGNTTRQRLSGTISSNAQGVSVCRDAAQKKAAQQLSRGLRAHHIWKSGRPQMPLHGPGLSSGISFSSHRPVLGSLACREVLETSWQPRDPALLASFWLCVCVHAKSAHAQAEPDFQDVPLIRNAAEAISWQTFSLCFDPTYRISVP